MNKILSTLLFAFLGVVVILVLLTSLANSVASAASSAALLTSQCMAFFMVIVALVAGVVFGANTLAFLQQRKTHQMDRRQVHILPPAYSRITPYPQLPPAMLDLLALPAPDDDDGEQELSEAIAGLFKDLP